MTNSSVLLPDPNVDIKKTVENVVNAVIGEDHGGVTVNKKGTVTIPWPTVLFSSLSYCAQQI
jgi:hypothetical protein